MEHQQEEEANPNILLVDDHPPDLAVIRRMLEHAGFKSFEALNVKTALLILHQHSRDIALIISDLLMSDIDGFSFIRLIRQEIEFRHIPVVLISALAFNLGEIEQLYGRPSHAAAYLPKPIQYDNLVRCVSQLTDSKVL